MRRWTPVFVIVAMLALTGVATNYFYAIEVKTTLTASDLDIGDDVDITGDLNVDGITTLDDTTVDGPFEVNGATTLDMPVNIYDATQDPDALGAIVDVEEDSGKSQFIVTGQMGAIDDLGTPGDIALIGVLGPIGDAGTGEAPRIGFTNGTDSLDMALTTGGVDWDMPLGTDTTLTVGNSGAGDGVVQADRLEVEFPGIISGTDSISVDSTGLNFYLEYGGLSFPDEYNYRFYRGSTRDLILDETENSTEAGVLRIGTSNSISDSMEVNIFGVSSITSIDGSISRFGDVWSFDAPSSQGKLEIDVASDLVTLESQNDLTLDTFDSTQNSTVSVTNSDSTYHSNLDLDGFLILKSTGNATVIASDAVTVSQTRTKLDTEGGAATDDLATITMAGGNVDGAILMLRTTGSTRDVTVKHLTGNIRLNGGVDYTLLNTSSTLTLIYNAPQSIWAEISRSTN